MASDPVASGDGGVERSFAGVHFRCGNDSIASRGPVISLS